MGAGERKLAHEDDRSLESLGSRLLYKLETPGVVDSLIERNLRSRPGTTSSVPESFVQGKIRRGERTLLQSWMALPSARGSVNGTPSSITSEPPRSMASMSGTVASTEGNPAVKKVTNAGAF